MRPITFSELSYRYFPNYSGYWARCKMKELICCNPELRDMLKGIDYRSRGYHFTPRQLEIIYELLGEPGE